MNGPATRITLRSPRPGDYGWVVSRHGALYAEEYGFDAQFEALVAEIVAGFIKTHDPTRERCWIAEKADAPVGCVFLVSQSTEIAKLRLLLVDAGARGSGLGMRLVAECIAFARACGYQKITLWTQSMLAPARHIYERTGFRLVSEEPHTSFGCELVGEYWELTL